MPPVPPSPGYVKELQQAVSRGSIERLLALLSIGGSIDIDSVDSTSDTSHTLLMCAAFKGYAEIAGILLNNGASTSIVGDDGTSALHFSALNGHLAVTKVLIEAGADLEARDSAGFTPLHTATMGGYLEVMGALIEAGGDPNSRDYLKGSTMLLNAASEGLVGAVKMLLRAGASPLLGIIASAGLIQTACIPLDVAAAKGRSGVVRELLQQVGIEGCGGESAGTYALHLASQGQRMDVMALLTQAGVVDTGTALTTAARNGCEASVQFLLQLERLEEEWGFIGEHAYYVNVRYPDGLTPLFYAIRSGHSVAPRIVRLLLDAEAATSSVFQLKDTRGKVVCIGTPLDMTTHLIGERKIAGKCATERQLHSLEAIRRLLSQVEAVNAVSWLWPSDVPSVAHAVEGESGSKKMTSTILTLMFPILRRRARRLRVLMAALFRYSGKT